MTGLTVHRHAVYRYRERFDCKKPRAYIREKLLKMAADSKEGGF